MVIANPVLTYSTYREPLRVVLSGQANISALYVVRPLLGGCLTNVAKKIQLEVAWPPADCDFTDR